MKPKYQSPRGTYDILPKDQPYWQFIKKTVTKRCLSFGFGEINPPIYELAEIFQKGVGESTDIVQKEMFETHRMGQEIENPEEKYALRPEFTAGICRAYLEHGMHTWPQPVKLFNSGGPVFRYGKPQKGRFRQFQQFDIEILGNEEPLTDALTILLVWQIFSDLKLSKYITLEINSIGCKKCQPKIKKNLINSIEVHQDRLCSDCQRRLYTNPLRVLDCKEKNCRQIIQTIPHIIDHLCAECKSHFTRVLELLDELKVTYDLNPFLVRGLDYYSRTTFEIIDKHDKASQASLGGGGRYDNLIELYGGQSTPAIGFAGGIERIIEKLKEKEVEVPKIAQADIFSIHIGEKAKKIGLRIISDLSELGFRISCALGKETLKSQLKAADKVKAKVALIVGQREALDKSVIIRNMNEATQETIDMKDLGDYLKKILPMEKNDYTGLDKFK